MDMEDFNTHKFRIDKIGVQSKLVKNNDSLGNVRLKWIDSKIEIELSSIGDFSEFINKDGKLMTEHLKYHILTRLFSEDITEQIVGDMGIITL